MERTARIFIAMLLLLGLLSVVGTPVITGAAVARGEFPEHTSLGQPYQPSNEEVKPLSAFEGGDRLEPFQLRREG